MKKYISQTFIENSVTQIPSMESLPVSKVDKKREDTDKLTDDKDQKQSGENPNNDYSGGLHATKDYNTIGDITNQAVSLG